MTKHTTTVLLSPRDRRTYDDISADIRETFGFVHRPADLLSRNIGKLELNERETFGLALSHANTARRPDGSRVANHCPHSTRECRRHCVSQSGKGGLETVQRARAWKSVLFADFPELFVDRVGFELRRGVSRFGPIGHRPNAFSDIRWEDIAPEWFGIDEVSHYDYTKFAPGTRDVPPSYHLTYSASERHTDRDIVEMLTDGHNVAVPFDVVKGHRLPRTFHGFMVIDGDVSDDRTLDPRAGRYGRRRGVVVGLRAKGTLRTASSAFKHSVNR